MSRTLRDVTRSLWPRRAIRPTLYGCRHQFCANAKLFYRNKPDADAVIAALMGHASDDTAHKHYAREKQGTTGAIVPRPDTNEVARVKCVRVKRQARLTTHRNTSVSPAGPQGR